MLVGPAVGQSKPSTDAQTPIVYGRGMFVCVSEEGAVAVRIVRPVGSANETGNGLVRIRYQWRFLSASNPDGDEMKGAGKVLHTLKDGRSTKASSAMKIGSTTVGWQYQSPRVGLIEFNPRKQRIYVFEETSFEGMPGHIPPLGLKAFLLGDSSSAKTKAVVVGGLVSYEGTATLVQGPEGLAIIKFGEVFSRELPNARQQHGVSYLFRYLPDSGSDTKGEGEVYESYKNNMYDSAGSSVVVRAGAIEMDWSRGGDEDGFLYYDPSKMRIQTCKASDVEKLLQ